jgi:hypothetical protein
MIHNNYVIHQYDLKVRILLDRVNCAGSHVYVQETVFPAKDPTLNALLPINSQGSLLGPQ